MPPLSLSKNPRVDKGPQPLMFNPALTTCASERMKTQRFSYFADFAARERMREAKPVKLKKVAFSHFFDTLGAAFMPPLLPDGWGYVTDGVWGNPPYDLSPSTTVRSFVSLPLSTVIVTVSPTLYS